MDTSVEAQATRPATAGSKRKEGFDLEGFVDDVGQVIIEMDMKIKQLEYRLGEESPNVLKLADKPDNVRPNSDSDSSAMEAEPLGNGQSYYTEVNEIQPIPNIRNRLGKLVNTPKSRAVPLDPTSARVFKYKEGKSGQLLRDTVV